MDFDEQACAEHGAGRSMRRGGRLPNLARLSAGCWRSGPADMPLRPLNHSELPSAEPSGLQIAAQRQSLPQHYNSHRIQVMEYDCYYIKQCLLIEHALEIHGLTRSIGLMHILIATDYGYRMTAILSD